MNTPALIPADMLREAAARGVERARQAGRPVVVSVSGGCAAPVLLSLLAAAERSAVHVTYLARPSESRGALALGAAAEVTAAGAGRFAEMEALRRELLANAVVAGGRGPLMVGGFAFDDEVQPDGPWADFPAAALVLPRALVATSRGATTVTLNGIANPGDTPDAVLRPAADLWQRVAAGAAGANGHQSCGSPAARHSRPESCPREDGAGITAAPVPPRKDASPWRGAVAKAAAAVRADELQKVVLARAVRIDLAIERWRVVERLQSRAQHATVFAVSRGGSCFVGASPETLVSVRDGRVAVACLAGTAARGETRAEDDELARRLLADPKERWEHELVRRTVVEALTDACEELDPGPGVPLVVRLPHVQHLSTPVRARTARAGVLELAGRLHPTPAVGGIPRAAALAFAREHEDFDRGWYAGGIGFVRPAGDGELAVAIRSALLDDRGAWLFAGCGIVGDSDAEREWRESELKLRTMRSALDGGLRPPASRAGADRRTACPHGPAGGGGRP